MLTTSPFCSSKSLITLLRFPYKWSESHHVHRCDSHLYIRCDSHRTFIYRRNKNKGIGYSGVDVSGNRRMWCRCPHRKEWLQAPFCAAFVVYKDNTFIPYSQTILFFSIKKTPFDGNRHIIQPPSSSMINTFIIQHKITTDNI